MSEKERENKKFDSVKSLATDVRQLKLFIHTTHDNAGNHSLN